jgi:hypothetical protein
MRGPHEKTYAELINTYTKTFNSAAVSCWYKIKYVGVDFHNIVVDKLHTKLSFIFN